MVAAVEDVVGAAVGVIVGIAVGLGVGPWVVGPGSVMKDMLSAQVQDTLRSCVGEGNTCNSPAISLLQLATARDN